MDSTQRTPQKQPRDYSTVSRTPVDQEYTFLAIGMVAGAVPGVIIGLLMAIPLGHAAMWVSVAGGVGILVGLLIAVVMYRRKHTTRSSSEGS